MSWNYHELIDSFIEECEEYKNMYHQSHYEAVSQAFDENYSEEYSDDMEKAIIWVVASELRIQQPRMYKVAKEKYISNLKSINFEKVKEYIKKGQMSEEEFNELYSRRNRVLVELEKLPVDLCPKARWFYKETVSTVNNYFMESENIDDSITYVIKSFEREFRNKACAKKIVYTTIAENLIRQNVKVPEYIINEIKDGYFDNSQFELIEEESLELSRRIDNVLQELKGKDIFPRR